MKKVISILVSLAILLSFSSVGVLAADGSRKDMYSAYNKRTFTLQSYSWDDSQSISLQLLETIEGVEALSILSENEYNTKPKADEQFLILKFYLKYNSGPEKELDAYEVINSNYFFDISGKKADIDVYTSLPDSYTDYGDVALYPGASSIFYYPIITKSAVGYPVFKSFNKTKEVWFNTDPNFKESANAKVSVKSVGINATAVTLNRGKAITLEAIVSPNNATNKSVSWKSSKPSVAIVDGKGRVTAKSTGTTTITATTSDGKKVTKSTITVK